MAKKLLLIEPNRQLGAIYAQALRLQGYLVTHSLDAQAAIAAADSCRPDLVILELELARHNGIEFIYEFRSYSEWQGIPIVVLTQVPFYGSSELRTIIEKLVGAKNILYKPTTSIRTLLDRLEKISAQQPLRATGSS